MASTDTKIVVITGCSSGIGMDTAVLLAKEKKYKIIATMRNLKKKENLETAARDTLGKSLIIKELDISKEDSILRFMKEILESEGKIDVLINNAASGQFQSFETVTLEQMQSLFQTNFFGTMRITQEVVREMKKRKSGQIIFITSMLGFFPLIFYDFYVATKFAIEGVVGCLAPYLWQFNIRVNSIQAGPVDTAFNRNIDANNQGWVPGFSGDKDAAKQKEENDSLTEVFLDKYMVHLGAMLTDQGQTGATVAEMTAFHKTLSISVSPGRTGHTDHPRTDTTRRQVRYSHRGIVNHPTSTIPSIFVEPYGAVCPLNKFNRIVPSL